MQSYKVLKYMVQLPQPNAESIIPKSAVSLEKIHR